MENEEEQSIDAFGNVLSHGDTIMLTKALDVRGAKVNLKKGTVIKGIRLTDNPEEIACSAPGVKGLILRTEFVKRSKIWYILDI
jgi:protein PhnA